MLVCQLGVRDRHLAAHPLQVGDIGAAGLHPLVDRLVDHRVDARDEEAGYARHLADVPALGVQILEPGDERLRHRLVGLLAEQQRDVDVQPFADQRTDRRHACLGAGHLDHQVVALHPRPEPPRLGDGVVRAQRQIGRDFEADIAVDLLRRIIDRAQQVGGVLDVLNRQVLVDALRVQVALVGQRLEPGVVIRAVAHRLLEDGRVGGHPLQPVAVDQGLQPPIGQEAALDEVQPWRLAECFERLERVRSLRRGWHVVHDQSPQ